MISDFNQASTPSTPTVIVDSEVIAEYLELAYPSTEPIFPPGSKALISMFQAWTRTKVVGLIGPLVVSSVPEILDQEGAEYFRRTREVSFNKPSVYDICPKGEARREIWDKLKKEFDTLDSQMARNGEAGRWIMGERITYADMILSALFVWMKSVPSGAIRDGAEFETVWEFMKEWNEGRWKDMLAAMEPWMQQK